jgi:hypothetical protein
VAVSDQIPPPPAEGSPDRTPDPADLSRIGEDDFLDAIGWRPQAPDLTRSIMGRLGYVREPRSSAARRRTRVRIGQIVLAFGAGCLVFAALAIHQRGPSARRPLPTTLPGAVERDIASLARSIRLIRDIAAPTQPVAKTPDRVEPPNPPPVEAGGGADAEAPPADGPDRPRPQ